MIQREIGKDGDGGAEYEKKNSIKKGIFQMLATNMSQPKN